MGSAERCGGLAQPHQAEPRLAAHRDRRVLKCLNSMLRMLYVRGSAFVVACLVSRSGLGTADNRAEWRLLFFTVCNSSLVVISIAIRSSTIVRVVF